MKSQIFIFDVDDELQLIRMENGKAEEMISNISRVSNPIPETSMLSQSGEAKDLLVGISTISKISSSSPVDLPPSSSSMDINKIAPASAKVANPANFDKSNKIHMATCDACEFFSQDQTGSGAGIGRCKHGIEWTEEISGRMPLYRYARRYCNRFIMR